MVKVFKNLAIILILSSCSYFNKPSLDDNRPKIRIVDLNGKPHRVKTRVPVLNAEIISKINQTNNSAANQPAIIQSKQPDYNIAPQNPGQYNKVVPSDQLAESEKFDGSGYTIQNISQETKDNNSYNDVNKLGDNSKRDQNNPDRKDLDNPQIATNTENSSGQLTNQSQNNPALFAPQEPKENNSPSFKFIGSKISASNNELVPKNAKVKNVTHGIFVQSGSFASVDNANRNLKRVSAVHKAMIEESISGNQKSYRVLIGPFSNKKQAIAVIKKLSKSGQKSFLVKK
jgi:cell division protein FtsN